MTELEKLKMDDDYINQNDIVKRYLHNKLTPEETLEFEVYILDKPELLEQLELDMVLIETLPKVNVVEKQKREEKSELKPSFWQVLLGTPIKASFATGFACVLFAALLFPISEQPSSITGNIEIFYLSDVRGGTFEQKFEVAQTADTLIFVLEAEFAQPEPFEVKLINQETGKQIPLLESYIPSEVGEIYVSIGAQTLPKGKYRFEYYPAAEEDKKLFSTLIIE